MLSFLWSTVALFSQTSTPSPWYQKLELKEVGFVTSYYQQDGNNSAVTGGIGTEKLSDFSNHLNITLRVNDDDGRTHDITVSGGVDMYTSASSDNIDNIPSSASTTDVRVYPQVTYANTAPDGLSGYSANVSVSTEFDYFSVGFGGGWWAQSQSKNSLFAVEGQIFLDSWKYILAQELRPPGYGSGSENSNVDRKARNSFNLGLTYNQILTRRLQISLLATPAYQAGLLSTPFHRVYDSNGSVMTEVLPSERLKLPLGIRANYFLGSHMVIRAHYRFYVDNWGVTAHSANLEVPVKIGPSWTFSPYFRLHQQSAADYYKPYGMHDAGAEFRTSDIDLSQLKSAMAGLQIRYVDLDGFFGIAQWNELELRMGYYAQDRGLNSQIISFGTSYKM